MKKYTVLSCALAVLLSGCVALSKNDPPRSFDQEAGLAKHVISVDRDGNLKIIENDEIKDTVACNSNSKGKTEENSEENRKCDGYLDGVIKGIEEFKSGKQNAEVLFFVHGGLNKPEESLERAKKQLALVHKDGKYNNIYPIFVIWDSRGPSSYTEHLWSTRQGEKDSFARYTSPIYFLTDVGNSIVNAPKAWLVSGLHMFYATTDRRIEDTLREEVRKFNNVYYTGNKDKKKEFYNFKRSTQWFLTSPSKVVTTPFVYTIGKPAWDIMLRRTNTLFYTPNDLKLQEKDRKKPPTGWSRTLSTLEPSKPGSGALYSFLEKLNKKPGINITLVGHSMGAIIVNKIVSLKPDLPYKSIVHMASADSINNLFNIIVPYINYKKPDVNFYSLMLHPDIENRELSAGGLTPSGSLLTWIDEMYTTPETVFDRRSGRWDNIKKTIPYLPEKVKGKMHFKIFGIKGSEKCKNKKDCPQEHGDFDEIRFWDKTTWE